ncbi:transposable element [Hordeum vulgare]|nr:transposable element [Hordeum vulgare]
MTLSDPDRLDIRQLKHRLTTSFGLDPEVCSPPDVDASQAEKESYYVPHNISSGHETGESIQSILLAGSGVADGDEEGDEMQRVREEENEDGFAEDLDSENSEDEVEVPIPIAWDQDIAADITVNDGHETPWQYNLNQVQIRAMFDTKKKMKYAVIKWAMSTQRVFRTHIWSPTKYTVKCVEIGCPTKVHGHVPKYKIH